MLRFSLFLLAAGLTFGAATPTLAQTGAPVTATANGNLLNMSRLSTKHTTLMKAMKAAGLDEKARSAGRYTVFAPTDAAFNKLPAGKLDELMKPANKKQLVALLTYHVVQGDYLAANLKDGQTLTTIQGEPLMVMRSGNAIKLKDAQGNMVDVVNDDIVASNGIIHSIDTVLMPSKMTVTASK